MQPSDTAEALPCYSDPRLLGEELRTETPRVELQLKLFRTSSLTAPFKVHSRIRRQGGAGLPQACSLAMIQIIPLNSLPGGFKTEIIFVNFLSCGSLCR